MKQPIRYFSIGMLFSSVVLLLFFLFIDEEADVISFPVEDLKQVLKEEGFHVLSEEEYISLSVATNANQHEVTSNADEVTAEDDADAITEATDADSEEATEAEANEEEKEETVKTIVTYILTIEPNMLGPTISQKLADQQIIDDPTEFNRYLEDEGYSRYIQLGDHKVTSDMSFKEIAETITTYK